jgi:uncharacterized lipoprotein YmbA
MTGRRQLLGGVLGGAPALWLAACAGQPAAYFRLATLPGAVQPGGPAALTLRNIGIPGYLDQSGIGAPGGAYRFETFPNDLWAEPLADMLQSVMVQELAQRLPGTNVLASGGAVAAPADMLIEINLLRFDPAPGGGMVLTAQTAFKSGKTRDLWRQATITRAAPVGADVNSVLTVMSQLWAATADQLAALVVSVWQDHAGAGR